LISREEDEIVNVSLKSYKRLIKNIEIPGILLVLLVLYCLNDIAFSLFQRALGLYGGTKVGENEGQSDKKVIFYFAGVALLVYFVLSIVKYMLTNYAI
jgi:hypothetical protein